MDKININLPTARNLHICQVSPPLEKDSFKFWCAFTKNLCLSRLAKQIKSLFAQYLSLLLSFIDFQALHVQKMLAFVRSNRFLILKADPIGIIGHILPSHFLSLMSLLPFA